MLAVAAYLPLFNPCIVANYQFIIPQPFHSIITGVLIQHTRFVRLQKSGKTDDAGAKNRLNIWLCVSRL